MTRAMAMKADLPLLWHRTSGEYAAVHKFDSGRSILWGDISTEDGIEYSVMGTRLIKLCVRHEVNIRIPMEVTTAIENPISFYSEAGADYNWYYHLDPGRHSKLIFERTGRHVNPNPHVEILYSAPDDRIFYKLLSQFATPILIEASVVPWDEEVAVQVAKLTAEYPNAFE